ncbi:acetoin utilization deacetylase AcuC-like enzyme [Breoghania corrubedonensis]|uniref:Acetoin utilization deacetylase AcuC-like enzyme n=2 Tax=Breoghania corrubedonensis TaxID=665038 RepID=A0A2T5VEI5_9HYPH|nr:acetoin utilization deacetylase AcuC-like enzyme [Breoghania corrubedonensis]
MRVVDRILEHERFQTLERDVAPMGEIEAVELAHPARHVEMIRKNMPMEGLARLDADTTVSAGSWEAALRAVGAGCQAVDEVMEGKVKNAFCAIRPPGHHAEHERAMGFCLFNNIAIAARHAQKRHGAERVAIIDFDVHHGNGTQDIFWDDPSVMYCSTHQMPLFPGTGAANETGAGNIVNAPLMAGDGSAQFQEAVEVMLLPRLTDFRPDLVLISAGFDAHKRDPLANINLLEDDFAWITAKLMDIADQSCGGRVVSMLEGGYDLEGLARSVAAHVMTLMDA